MESSRFRPKHNTVQVSLRMLEEISLTTYYYSSERQVRSDGWDCEGKRVQAEKSNVEQEVDKR